MSTFKRNILQMVHTHNEYMSWTPGSLLQV